MIVKPLRVPPILFQLDALRRRLPRQHERQADIKEQWRRRVAGFKGEQSLAYELSLIDQDEYLVFHDVRLPIGEYFAQFDLLILCSRFIVIIEVKNIAGQLYFAPTFHQLIRTLEGETETFPDPIVQNERQVMQFRRWLSSYQFSDIPLLPLVVISSKHSQIQTKSGYESISNYVIHKAYLPQMIQRYEQFYQRSLYSDRQVLQLKELLLQSHTPAVHDWGLTPMPGVHCPTCDSLPLSRNRGKWLCPSCGSVSRNAHYHSLRDYFYLVNTSLTNEDAQHFLQFYNSYLIRIWLKSLKKGV